MIRNNPILWSLVIAGFVVLLMVYETVFMKTNVSTILSKVGTPAP